MNAVDLSLLEGEPIRPMRRVEYEALASAGHFEDERVELLFGMVVQMSPIDPAHGQSTTLVGDLLRPQLAGRADLRSQMPLAASEWSEPEPDVFVIPRGDYWHAHPDRAFLVVEVSRSSLRRDRGIKAKLYALANVDEYWIVDHVHEQIDVFRDARDGVWTAHTTHRRGETISMASLPDVRLAVADVLPPV